MDTPEEEEPQEYYGEDCEGSGYYDGDNECVDEECEAYADDYENAAAAGEGEEDQQVYGEDDSVGFGQEEGYEQEFLDTQQGYQDLNSEGVVGGVEGDTSGGCGVMAGCYKGLFKALKREVTNEVTKQIEKAVGGGQGGSGGGDGGFDLGAVQGILGLISGGGGGGAGGFNIASLTGGSGGKPDITSIINTIQNLSGGILPTSVAKYLPGILKVAEIIGHGLGDDSPRTQRNSDGSFIDDFVRTIIGGRKVYGGGGGSVGGFAGGYSGSQEFSTIQRECLSNGVLFEDSEFPAEDGSVWFSGGERGGFEWLRPHEITSNPEFFVAGASRFDVKQGELGDCWLLAAVANLTLNEGLFHEVVPVDNTFGDGYCGAFRFRFWQYGEWVEVVVDDRLPTRRGKLVFMHSEDSCEFWSALLEKAYAKLHGSYEALKGGTTCEALEDFTGGITEMYDVKNGPTMLFQIMENAFERSSFMGCSIEPDPNVVEAEMDVGLIRGHAYSITSVKIVDMGGRAVQLLRIRNPWGNEAEWKGAWGDGSREWEGISDDVKEDVGLCFDADGEFWMGYKDFKSYWDRLEICHLGADGYGGGGEGGGGKWVCDSFSGGWVRGVSAGGCRNYLETFASNPQYVFELTNPDAGESDGKCTVLIALMQKNRRAQRKYGVECLTIGFAIYALGGDEERPLPMNFFKYSGSVARSPTFINLREVSCRFRLGVGKYVVVPSCFEPGEEGEFLLRVFSSGGVGLVEWG